jgi:putative restriction endonuclease
MIGYPWSMARALPQGGLSVDDLYGTPDDYGLKHELESGLLVAEPAPGARHGYSAARMCRLIATHVDERGLGVVFGNDTGYVLARSPDTVRGPDVSFVARERLGQVELPVGPFPGAPDLAVETIPQQHAGAHPGQGRRLPGGRHPARLDRRPGFEDGHGLPFPARPTHP